MTRRAGLLIAAVAVAMCAVIGGVMWPTLTYRTSRSGSGLGPVPPPAVTQCLYFPELAIDLGVRRGVVTHLVS